MPELPEVETVRRGIERAAVGRLIDQVDIGRERSVRRVGREAVIAGLTGRRLTAASRRGKYLLCDLDDGEARMMIHLRMSGRVMITHPDDTRLAHTHVVMHLAPTTALCEAELRFVDPRTFGEVVVYDVEDELRVLPELSRLGVDPIVDEFNADVLERALRRRKGMIKPVLLDQHVVAGIGNIYADEVLHRAGLRWDRRIDSLRRPRIERLADAITEVLTTAIECGGSTLDDTQYVDVDGETGSFQHEHRVYAREGEGCLTCGRGKIRRVMVAGRSSSYCPKCQR